MKLEVNYDIVCPFHGTVDEIFFFVGDDIEEGEVIFSLKVDGIPMQILSPVSGSIERMEVSLGENVISGMILGTVIEKE